MCYYNSIKVNPGDLIKLQQFEKTVGQLPFISRELMNGFDYGPAAVLKRNEEKNNFDIVEMQWGFLPPSVKTREAALQFRNGYKKANGQWQQPILTLNARGEELLHPNKIFRSAALHRRCLLLSSGFFEWRHVCRVNKRTGKPLKTPDKYPYHIGLKEREYFYIAAVWEPWKDVETGEYVETFSVVTTEANEVMGQIHNSKKRMPAILNDDLAYEWLMEDLPESRIRETACFQIPAKCMEVCTVAKDFREALEPAQEFSYADLPAITFD